MPATITIIEYSFVDADWTPPTGAQWREIIVGDDISNLPALLFSRPNESERARTGEVTQDDIDRAAANLAAAATWYRVYAERTGRPDDDQRARNVEVHAPTATRTRFVRVEHPPFTPKARG